MTDSVASTCSTCSAPLDPGAAFCAGCGAPVGVQPASRPAPSILFGKSLVEGEREGRLQRASKWLLALSIIFALIGTILGFQTRSEAEKARAQLAQMDPSQIVQVEGETYSVEQLGRAIDREVTLVFALNYFLAVVMLGLFFWSRKAPFPAMVTGLCVYLAVIVLNGVLEPKTLYQGIVIKVLFIGALIAGIRAALEQRDHEQRTASPARDQPPA